MVSPLLLRRLQRLNAVYKWDAWVAPHQLPAAPAPSPPPSPPHSFAMLAARGAPNSGGSGGESEKENSADAPALPDTVTVRKRRGAKPRAWVDSPPSENPTVGSSPAAAGVPGAFHEARRLFDPGDDVADPADRRRGVSSRRDSAGVAGDNGAENLGSGPRGADEREASLALSPVLLPSPLPPASPLSPAPYPSSSPQVAAEDHAEQVDSSPPAPTLSGGAPQSPLAGKSHGSGAGAVFSSPQRPAAHMVRPVLSSHCIMSSSSSSSSEDEDEGSIIDLTRSAAMAPPLTPAAAFRVYAVSDSDSDSDSASASFNGLGGGSGGGRANRYHRAPGPPVTASVPGKAPKTPKAPAPKTPAPKTPAPKTPARPPVTGGGGGGSGGGGGRTAAVPVAHKTPFAAARAFKKLREARAKELALSFDDACFGCALRSFQLKLAHRKSFS